MNQEDLAVIEAALQSTPEGEEPEPNQPTQPDSPIEPPVPDTVPTPKGIQWRDLLRGASVQLEKLPDPGGIIFPLMILLLFFLILIPINGHTRLTWIWLVLTGNAQIGQGSGGGSTQPVDQPIAPVPAMPTSHVGGF